MCIWKYYLTPNFKTQSNATDLAKHWSPSQPISVLNIAGCGVWNNSIRFAGETLGEVFQSLPPTARPPSSNRRPNAEKFSNKKDAPFKKRFQHSWYASAIRLAVKSIYNDFKASCNLCIDISSRNQRWIACGIRQKCGKCKEDFYRKSLFLPSNFSQEIHINKRCFGAGFSVFCNI